MKNYNKQLTPTRIIFTLFLLLSVFAGCGDDGSAPATEKFTLTYDANGGSGEMKAETAEEGTEITIAQNAFSYDSYDFTGWNTVADGSGASYAAGEKITLTEDLTLYAQWKEIVKVFYTVKFDANGGSGEMKEVTAESGSEVIVAANAFSRDGWTFGGWNTKSDGTGAPYNDKAKITLDADITLYAQWAAGTGTAYKIEHWQQNVADSGYTLAKTEPMTGTTGEETAAKAEETAGFTAKEFAQEKIAADGSTVVKIYYDRKTVTLTFDADNGEDKTTLSERFGAEIKIDAPSKTGYSFNGWNPELPATFPAENAEFKAQWKAETYQINYTLNDGTNAKANPASYTIETEKVTFASPTRKYYAFCGWFTDSAFTDSSKITGWSTGEKTGDITLYAKWEMTLESLGLADGKIVLTDDIPEETLRAVAATILANPGENIILDLGGTTITEIPDKLFHEVDENGDVKPCTNLVGIILPKNLKSIGEQAFLLCIGLTEVEIPSGTTSIGDYAFLNTGIKSAKIPASIETVGVEAFSCSREVYAEIKRKIETVEYGGTLAEWQNLYVGKDEDSYYYGLQHAVVTTSDGGICCPEDKFEEVLKTFGAGSEAHIAVRASHPSEFVNCITIASAMKSNSGIKVHLDLSKSKTESNYEKFKDCTNLVGIELSTLDTDIMSNDFEGCTGLKSITIPANITEIEGKAFYNCTGLEEVTFLGNISKADRPFDGCTKLSKVNLPDGLTGIPGDIFAHLTALTSIEIPASVTEIGDAAFYNSGLTSVELPSGLKVIEMNAFYECKGLKSVEIPAGVTRIGMYAFSGTSLTKVTINAVDIVLAHPFLSSTNLTDVYYAGTMAEWEALKDKVSPEEGESSFVAIGFSSAPLATAKIHCSDGVIASVSTSASEAATVISGFTEAGTYTVTVTGGITNSDLTAIKNAMSGNPDAKIVLDISGTTGLTEIPERAFMLCSSLAGIKLPASLTSIGDKAFYYNDDISTIVNFGGSKAQWNAITVGADNRLLNKANIVIHCSDGDI